MPGLFFYFSSADPAFFIIGLVQCAEAYATVCCGMYERIALQENTDMTDGFFCLGGIEKDQVARSESVARNLPAIFFIHACHGTFQLQPVYFPVDVAYQP